MGNGPFELRHGTAKPSTMEKGKFKSFVAKDTAKERYPYLSWICYQ